MRAGVQGREVTAELELFEDFVVEKHGFKEVGAAMDDAVADAFDLVHVRDDARLRIGEVFDDDFGRDGVVGHRDVRLDLFAVLTLAVFDASVDADSLADTLRENGFRGGVEELVLQGRRACIDN